MGILNTAIKNTVQGVLDSLLVDGTQGGFGKECMLVFPAKSVPCGNCVFDPVGQRSLNRYKTGGPVPFSSGQPCPICGGQNLKQVAATQPIILKCNWESKHFVFPFKGIELKAPYSIMETKGYMSDLPIIMKADHIIANLPITPIIKQKFKIIGEPGDPSNIIQGRYVVIYWERWNG